MFHFHKTIKLKTLSLALVAGMTALTHISAAVADDRTAGSNRTEHKREKETVLTETQAASEVVNEAQETQETQNLDEDVLDVDFDRLETRGSVKADDDLYIGFDLWSGSRYSDIIEMISALPSELDSRVLQGLSQSILTTQPDMAMLRRDKNPDPGKDLTSLRLERLIERGSFTHAARLFAADMQPAYHEGLARNGVIALMGDGQMMPACLEVMAMHERFNEKEFWQDIQALCENMMSRLSGNKKTELDANNKIIRDIISKSSFSITPNSFDKLENFTITERAALIGSNSLSFRDLNTTDLLNASIDWIDSIVNAQSTGDVAKFHILVRGAELSRHYEAPLAAFYKQTGDALIKKHGSGIKEYAAVTGWERLAYLYAALAEAEGEEESAILNRLLSLHGSYPRYAFAPFSAFLHAQTPDSLSGDELDASFDILSLSGDEMSANWSKKFLNEENIFYKNMNNLETLRYVILASKTVISENFETSAAIDISGFSEAEALLLENIYEKLDKRIKLHNYGGDGSYDKSMRLTLANDYVMPLDDLLKRLQYAQNNKALGEVILISSVLLGKSMNNQVDRPTKLYILDHVTDGLITVGLIKEARLLVQDTIAGIL